MKEKRTYYKRHYADGKIVFINKNPWTDKEIDLLKKYIHEGLSHQKIAQKLKRSFYSIQLKALSSGLIKKDKEKEETKPPLRTISPEIFKSWQKEDQNSFLSVYPLPPFHPALRPKHVKKADWNAIREERYGTYQHNIHKKIYKKS